MIELNLHDNIKNTYDAHSNTKTKHLHMPSIDVWTIYFHSTNMMSCSAEIYRCTNPCLHLGTDKQHKHKVVLHGKTHYTDS